MKRLFRIASFLLTPLMAVLPLAAQQPSPTPNPAAASSLQIHLVDHDPGSVTGSSHATKDFVIEITDSKGAPVADAVVALRLPDEGPSGAFPDGTHAAVAYTSFGGRAQFAPIAWGAAPGTAVLRITVVKGDIHAGALIEEAITAPDIAARPAALSNKTPAAKVLAQSAPPSGPSVLVIPVAPLGSSSTAPGTPQSVASVHSATPGETSAANVNTSASTDAPPVVSVTNTSASSGGIHSSKTKWILFAVVAVGAGVGAAIALGGHGGGATPNPTASLSIGAPTISLGH